MGASGVGIFDDDSSLDWIEDEYTAGGEEAVRAALDEAAETKAGDFLDYDAGVAARTAAEVVAASFGAPPELADEDAMDTLMEHAESVAEDDDMIPLALRAVSRLAAENSGLAEAWQEAFSDADTAHWKAAIEGLEARLKGLQ